MAELKKNKKAFDSQARIYKSLRRILKTKPLSEVTVADISNECGISRSSFYRNFSNVVEVLEIMLEYFYNRYLEQRVGKENQLLFFFEYFYYHRDLITLVAKQNEGVLKRCIKKLDNKCYDDNPILFELHVSLLTTILIYWSETKLYTPAEMEQKTRELLDKKAIDILLQYDI